MQENTASGGLAEELTFNQNEVKEPHGYVRKEFSGRRE